MKEKTFTFSTMNGCKKLLALFIVIILISSFFAQLVQTNGGEIKVEPITIDARGAEMTGELYYPAGTTGNDKMPAVIVNHGGGCIYGCFKNTAEEIARRGFVVFNVSAYGSGLSAQPDYDEVGQGIEGYYQSLNVVEGQQGFLPTATPMGLHDAIDFVRGLAMVDTENIGIVGHSMGAYRISAATTLDCGYLSLNDTMLNVLCDEFGQTISEEEIALNADDIAADRLNEDQLAHYNTIRAQKEEYFNTRVKAEIILGIGYEATTSHPETVTVAGHEVSRNVQTNICYMAGGYDNGYQLATYEPIKTDWHAAEDLVMGNWYSLDDNAASLTDLGSSFTNHAVGNADITAALQNKTSRMFIITGKETHSKEFFSSKTNTAIVSYFEQALGYNNGYLASGNAQPLDASNNTWMWRVVFNTIALFAMIGMLAALAGILVKCNAFKTAIVEIDETKRVKLTKGQSAIIGVLTVALAFECIYYANAKGLFIFNPTKFWPLGRGFSLSATFVIALAIMSVIILAVAVLFHKKNSGHLGLEVLNIGIGFKNVIKHLTMAVILLIAAYASLAVIQYFFGQEYRIWMTCFAEMKADYWYIALRFLVLLFPMYFIISCAINYTARNDIPEWKDTLYTVVINSVGIWLCCLINWLIVSSKPYDGTFFSSFICSYQLLSVVPITVYLNRKMYKTTKSIWVSALLTALVMAWSMVCTLGVNDVFYGQTWLGNFLFY